MHKNAMKCNKTLSKWFKNKHGASKIIDTLETYQCYLSKLSNTSHFVPLFLAHEDVVVGIAIFLIKLSTPRLGKGAGQTIVI
jgi:hypothetical protein